MSNEETLVGIAPADIDQNCHDEHNGQAAYHECGWYFHDKKTGHERDKIGHTVGVIADLINGTLSFIINGVNQGVSYNDIPLNRPLVPCVLLDCEGNSVELLTYEVKENIDNSIPVPQKIMVIKDAKWDSITLLWDAVEGASSYQVEANGFINKMVKENSFTQHKILSDTEYKFRVRTIKENAVSEWSDVIKGKTMEIPTKLSGWKKCPEYVTDEFKKYSVDGNNPRVATKTSKDYKYSTIIGNAPIPLGEITSWSIKIQRSIYIGVAPFDINQNEDDNYEKCGWYFYCYDSTLHSGPPHNYKWNGKEYGPRKDEGEYIHNGGSVGVVMDTKRGDLSFAINGVNLGVAYEGIPLDKPLVPCVLLKLEGDFVELVI